MCFREKTIILVNSLTFLSKHIKPISHAWRPRIIFCHFQIVNEKKETIIYKNFINKKYCNTFQMHNFTLKNNLIYYYNKI